MLNSFFRIKTKCTSKYVYYICALKKCFGLTYCSNVVEKLRIWSSKNSADLRGGLHLNAQMLKMLQQKNSWKSVKQSCRKFSTARMDFNFLDMMSRFWPAARHLPSCSLTPPSHQWKKGERRWKSLWIKKKTGRTLINYNHRQNRLYLGKINLISCQLK